MKFEAELIGQYGTDIHESGTGLFEIEKSFVLDIPRRLEQRQDWNDPPVHMCNVDFRFITFSEQQIVDLIHWHPRRVKITIEDIE